jgi:hypothetical protein
MICCMTYLRNTWYAAAWSDEIERAPFPLILEPIVLASDAAAVRVRMSLRGLISEGTKTSAATAGEPQFASAGSGAR